MAKSSKSKSGEPINPVLIVVGLLVVGVGGFFAGQASDDVLSGASTSRPQNVQQQADVPDLIIKPGNPVVAKVGDEDITRLDVLNFIQTLPPQTRQLPIGQIFPAALEQVINDRVIVGKTSGVNLDSDPKVKEQLERVKENIVREVYVQNEVEKRLTDARIQQAYENYKANFPAIEEARARHILVKEKSEARDIIKQLKEGADFAELAKEKSVDATAQSGGDIGYFAENEVVPEFAEAVFKASELNQALSSPVKSQFGYHVIEVLEKRQRPPASFEQAKPFLESQLRQLLLNQTVQEWKTQAGVSRFDINGESPGAHSHEGGDHEHSHSHDGESHNHSHGDHEHSHNG